MLTSMPLRYEWKGGRDFWCEVFSLPVTAFQLLGFISWASCSSEGAQEVTIWSHHFVVHLLANADPDL